MQPIKKVSPSKVALTSYYSKIFVSRSEKQVHNYAGWLAGRINSLSADNGGDIKHLMVSDVSDSTVKTPRVYSTIAQSYRSFQRNDLSFFFDYNAREAQYGAERVARVEKLGFVVAGAANDSLIGIDTANTVHLIDNDLNITELGSIETVLGIAGRGPMEIVEVKLLSKAVPIGIMLAYHMGLNRLIELLGVTPRRALTGERLHLQEDEFAVRFEDEVLVFSRENPIVTMVMAGFTTFENSTKNYPIHLFDRKEIYQNILDQNRLGPRYLREFDLMTELFVDPITSSILESMQEPTDFVGLLLRAVDLLQTDWSPDETDMEYMRIKGYERFAGAVYSELVKAVRMHRSRGNGSNSKIDVPPHAVWTTVTQDSGLKQVEESNPVHNMREKEEVTYSGRGGRSGRSMVRRTRAFHQNDMGVISESTKDSADVSITTFMTANPNLTDVRGKTKRYEPDQDGPATLLSSPALLSPAADTDDAKRVCKCAFR